MLEVVGAIGATAAYALLVGVLVGFARAGVRAKFAAFACALVWASIVVILATKGVFAPGAVGPIPGPILAFLTFLVLLLGMWFRSPGFRDSLLSIPTWALVGVNIARIGGVFF